MTLNAYSVVSYAWEGLGILWLIGLAFMKPVVRTEAVGARLLHLALGVLSFQLLTGVWIAREFMGAPFVPATSAVRTIGAGLTLAGCLFAVWARVMLGSNWSGRVTVKADHELIVKGPYALVRHPIYTGLLFAALGTSLVLDHWRCLLGFVVLVPAFLVKMTNEERLMMETFPSEYPAYRRRIKALIPGVI